MNKHPLFRHACSAGALACAALVAPSAIAAPALIQNDSFWKDTSGNTMYTQGGGILKVGSTYYWYGAKYAGAVTYAANPTKLNSDTRLEAVTVYSSTDLARWKFEGNALVGGAVGSTFDPGNWIGRMGVVYNANTRKYVLISQYWSEPTGSAVMFATSDTPVGPFTFHHLQSWITNVPTVATGDQTIYNDDDGRSWLVFSNSRGRQYGYVAQIRASDSLHIEPATRVTSNTAGREGNAMFKYNGRYYFCSSDLHGWNASHTYCNQSNAITGPYSAEKVMGNTDPDFSHVSQNGFFVQVNGTKGTTILYAGDRWSNFAGNGLGYNQWVPLSWNGTDPVFNSLNQWYLDAATNSWSIAPGNNFVRNPTFEADRIAQNALAGWKTWTNLTDGTNPNRNHLGGRTGRWSATMSHTAAYSASRFQVVTGLPNGTYTLKAWVKSSGGQTAATVFVKNFGGSELNVKVNAPITAWKEIIIPNINVTLGKAEIGFYAAANANNWLIADDFSLVKN